MMCGILFAISQEVRLVSRKRSSMVRIANNAIKMAMKREFHGRKLVAGAGFEPATFRL
jgi:hypothetical protein